MHACAFRLAKVESYLLRSTATTCAWSRLRDKLLCLLHHGWIPHEHLTHLREDLCKHQIAQPPPQPSLGRVMKDSLRHRTVAENAMIVEVSRAPNVYIRLVMIV